MFQLGFGSFLGIIGAHLIENKRQMVRGFILPLCIEIPFSAWCLLVIKLRTSPNYPYDSLQLDYVVNVTIDTADLTQTVSPTWPEEVCVSEQVSWASREMQPEIEIGCKWRRTDVHT